MQKKTSWGLHFFYLGVIIVLSILLGTKLAPSSGRAASPAPTPASLKIMGELERAFSGIAEKTAPSVVNINTEQIIERRDPNEDFFREFFGQSSPFTYKQRVTSLGSGVIVDRRGYVLTNVHVIRGADRIQVKLSDGTSYQAVPVAGNTAQDLAIIKLQAKKNFPVAVLGDAGKVRVGSWAIAVGSPFGFSESVTVGVISAKGRIITGKGQKFRDLLQTDASINPGNSGGPLLNLRGEVIGINQAIFSPSGVGNIGLGFAIPMTPQTRKAIKEAIDQA